MRKIGVHRAWLSSVLLASGLLASQVPVYAYDDAALPERLIFVDADVFLTQLDTQLHRGGDYEVLFVGGRVSANALPDRINRMLNSVRDAGGDIRVMVTTPEPEVRDRSLDSVVGGVRDFSRAVDGLEQLLTSRGTVTRMMRGNPYRGYDVEMRVDPDTAGVVQLLLVERQ